jgi:hypothetical protein
LARYEQALLHDSTFAPARFNEILTEKEISELGGIEPDYLDLYHKIQPLLGTNGSQVEMLSVSGDFSYQAALQMEDDARAVQLLKESANHYQSLLELEPNNCNVLFRMGHTFWKAATYEENNQGMDDAEKAKSAFRASLRCAPSKVKYVIAFADLLEFSASALPGDGIDDLKESISALSDSIILNPGIMELFYKRANKRLSLCHRLEGQQDKEQLLLLAKEDFETAIQGQIDNQRYLNNYGVALLELARIKKRSDSESLLKKAIAEAVNSYLNKANALIGLYDLFSVSDDLNAAENLCVKANGLRPQSADFLLEEITERR